VHGLTVVLRIAGEFEPSRRGNVQQVQQPTTRPGLRLKSAFHPVWGLALPSSGILRAALIAAAVGVCAGAVVGQSTFDTAVSNRSATRPTNQINLPPNRTTQQMENEPKQMQSSTAPQPHSENYAGRRSPRS
jgi:hypothetical protein